MKNSLMATAAISISVLSACGGDLVNKLDELANDFDDNAELTLNEQKFKDFSANVVLIEGGFVQSQSPDLPSGDARMKGYLALVDTGGANNEQRFTVGDAFINVDFSRNDNGSFLGTAKDFVMYEGTSDGCVSSLAPCTGENPEELVGELDISGSVIDSNIVPGFSYTLSGNLTATDLSGENANINPDNDILVGKFGEVAGLLVAESDVGQTVDVSLSDPNTPSETLQSEVMLHLQEKVRSFID